jgi:hypothetical protein
MTFALTKSFFFFGARFGAAFRAFFALALCGLDAFFFGMVPLLSLSLTPDS